MKDILHPAERATLAPFLQRNTLLAFDYDGTLAPIVGDPRQAFMRPRTRELLSQLVHRYAVAIVTGRSRLDALRLLDGVPVTEVIGNHGFEVGGASPEQFVPRVAEWRAWLQARLAPWPAIVVEDKRYSLAIHYRHCADPAQARVQLRAMAGQLDGARLIGGKSVLNVVPEGAPNKGEALLRLQARLHCPRVLYVGDDDTDEDVFVLGGSDGLLGIRVGESEESAAAYCVRDQEAVDELLGLLLQAG